MLNVQCIIMYIFTCRSTPSQSQEAEMEEDIDLGDDFPGNGIATSKLIYYMCEFT